MLARHFSRYLEANPGKLHFSAHSHHPWPDVTEAAQARYWQDSATLADHKWERVFGEVVPKAQAHIARILGLPDPALVAFAPNTHEFVTRLYSCLPQDRPLRVLTTAHEFHSFRRQTRRLLEDGRLEVTEIPGAPWETFTQRFCEAAKSQPWDMVWLSHVFFDSGFVVQDLEKICEAAPSNALVAIDGYHAFCAIPVDLCNVHKRAFYLGGGYKYAMAGEGAAYLAIPPGCALRPVDTGWFASFETLSARAGEKVAYSDGAMRFWGATFDPTGVYRLNASMDLLQSTGTSVEAIHHHAIAMQKHFLDGLRRLNLPHLGAGHLVPPPEVARGNFLAFDVDNSESMYRKLFDAGVLIDRRDRRLRFGFGVYHDAAMVAKLVEAVGRALGREKN
ncbi:MAG: aminotransferase class V-fold PLP-dependent enzyme [Usitatibacter sp.]